MGVSGELTQFSFFTELVDSNKSLNRGMTALGFTVPLSARPEMSLSDTLLSSGVKKWRRGKLLTYCSETKQQILMGPLLCIMHGCLPTQHIECRGSKHLDWQDRSFETISKSKSALKTKRIGLNKHT